ncbi:SMI1/KNR4 family protein [Foetidibacter luteolus]|uniref:SMI1/KNR4 family protein n=1 Tax=Foetidibacter luteolus TaxID=2608880 RepID=UPI00129A7E5E|nr:SMI1/KNR4 family protein [Foetidibacter luteolus]
MKFFNFFRTKSHRTASHLKEQSVENNFTKPDIKEKIIYNSDTTLLDVLNYIRDNSVQTGIQLNKPATQIEIGNFENQKAELPDDFKLLYKFSNGFETDHDLFRLIPLDEIIENGLDKSYLVSDTSFHFTEYMIYSDMWSVDISKHNINDYKIYNKTDTVVYLTNSLTEFLCVFINDGIYDGLYGWRETKQKSRK